MTFIRRALMYSGSDICTCRPYLIYGIEEAVKCAQRGGVGLIVYFRKEGRALGEVTKCTCPVLLPSLKPILSLSSTPSTRISLPLRITSFPLSASPQTSTPRFLTLRSSNANARPGIQLS